MDKTLPRFRYAAVFLVILIPVLLLFVGCGEQDTGKLILSIEKTDSVGNVDTYTITYTDGTTYTFTIENGTDGTNSIADIEAIYAVAVENGYSGTILDFISDYLSVDTDDSAATSKALLSSVSVKAPYTRTVLQPAYIDGVLQIISYDQEVTSAGSGVIYKLDKTAGDAYIITNYHVVYASDNKNDNKISDSIRVTLYGSNESIPAEYVGGSMTYDIAVLKVDNSENLRTSSAEAITLENSDNVSVGETAIAVGNPQGLGISATSGIVSVDSEYITMTAADDVSTVTFRVMRIDTAINSGNSGGGLFNSSGELIGIVNARMASTSIENIAYAIPSNLATAVADNIIDNAANFNGSVQKMVIGIETTGENSRAVYDNETGRTSIVEDAVISSVEKDSLAESAGLEVGDIITSIKINEDTYQITRNYQLTDLMLTVRSGEDIVINYTRDGAASSTTIHAATENFTTIV